MQLKCQRCRLMLQRSEHGNMGTQGNVIADLFARRYRVPDSEE